MALLFFQEFVFFAAFFYAPQIQVFHNGCSGNTMQNNGNQYYKTCNSPERFGIFKLYFIQRNSQVIKRPDAANAEKPNGRLFLSCDRYPDQPNPTSQWPDDENKYQPH